MLDKYIEAFLKGFYFCFAVCIFTVGGCIYIYITSQWKNENIIQELCSQKQYDFCEVTKTTYKLKEFKE